MTKTEQTDQAANEALIAALEAATGHKAQVGIVGGEIYEGKIKEVDGKDGERRFQVGRRIASVSNVTRVLDLEAPTVVEQAANAAGAAAKANGGQKAADKAADAVRREAQEPVTLTSGAVVTGKTLTIRCAWVDPDKRTKKQQALFDNGFAGVEKGKTYEAMVKAAGTGAMSEAAMPDGSERTIKVQDAFQVRFSVENQRKHRNEARRAKAKAKRATREAAKS